MDWASSRCDDPKVCLMAHDALARSYRTHCLTSGKRLVLERGPTDADRASGSWSYTCPDCGKSHRTVYGPAHVTELAELFEKIDIPMDVDLGQLISGQHVVLKGITLRTPWGSVLRYAFVPGFSQTDRALDTSWGLGKVMDDMGTDYDHQGAGGWGADADGIVRRGDENLGNGIPPSAAWLRIEFHHAHYWEPPESWSRTLTIDLSSGEITNVTRGATA